MTDPTRTLTLHALEPRLVPTGDLVQVSAADPFAGSTADSPASQPGTVYPNSQVEPFVAANPARANNLVGVWQQDRWSNGGARGIVVGVSDDHGNHWSATPLPGVSKTTGGPLARATDPWAAFGPTGTLFVSTLAWDPAPDGSGLEYPFDETHSAVYVSRSTDGGHTFGAPATLIDEPNPTLANGHPTLAFNDKEAVTADPTNPNDAFVVWTRISYDLVTGEFRGPTYFSRTTDGGKTWEPARPIVDPGPFAQTIGNQVVVLPDGTLVDVYAFGSEATGAGGLAAVRSTDHGATWSAPVVLASAATIPVVDPDTGEELRTGDTMPDVAVDRRTGALYVVSQSLQTATGELRGVVFFQSTDGGETWSAPVTINRTPRTALTGNGIAFNPSVEVAADGRVAVTYDDFRFNTPAPGLPTDVWAVFADPAAGRQSGGLTNPANWGGEVRLTDRSFDMELAPESTNENGGHFLGDYQGLAADGGRFLALVPEAGTAGDNTAGVFAGWVGGDDHGGRDVRDRDVQACIDPAGLFDGPGDRDGRSHRAAWPALLGWLEVDLHSGGACGRG